MAAKRGSKSISVEDLMFLIRHDKAKVNRLRNYLSWKDVRKNAKDQDGAAPDAATGEIIDDVDKMKIRKNKIRLPWDTAVMFSEPVPEGDDEEDEEELEANFQTLDRLRRADERTKAMTKDEYVHWSECRQASFTYRKAKRFREWASMSSITSTTPNDDIIDILGFLTFEIVATLTEQSLEVKTMFDELEEGERGFNSSSSPSSSSHNQKKRRAENERFLFDGPDEERTPLRAEHVNEAFRRLQSGKHTSTALRNFGGGLVKHRISLI